MQEDLKSMRQKLELSLLPCEPKHSCLAASNL